jgi:titin
MPKFYFAAQRPSRPTSASRRRAALRRRPAIEMMEDRQLMSGMTFYVSNSGDSGTGSLRQAIINSDNTPATASSPNVINFSELVNITRIEVQSALPAITQPVIIDGTTEGSYNGVHPFVQLIGAEAGGSAIGLDITASGTQVKALAIDAFNAGGVLIDNASNVTLESDWIGIDTNANATGPDANLNTIYEGNGTYGVTIQSENGGSSTGDLLSGDIVSANSYNGIILSGLGTVQNMVSGTIIGSDNTGAAVVDDPGNLLGNGQHGGGGSGVVINGGASLNTIGGTTAAAEDVILGNKSYGVYITGTSTNSNVVEGDAIGTDISELHGNDGSGKSYGNGLSGVAIDAGAQGTYISGTATAPEVIANNGGDGVLISGSGTNLNYVYGVNVGNDKNGANALPNAGDGVAVNGGAQSNDVGFTYGAQNTISGNAGNGVSLSGQGTDKNYLVNNLIGLASGGSAALANGGDGVLVNGQASNNSIGYAYVGSNNVISGNGTWGVYISDSGTNGNSVANNYIGTNSAGTAGVPNTNNGLDVVNSAADNTVGGTTSAARNVISGNDNEGVLIGLSATQNIVEGNFIGTDYTGTKSVGNHLDGVYVGLGAVNDTIGGQNPTGALNTAAWNVISGNLQSGIKVADSGTSGNTICGNFIGTDVTGKLAVPNQANGITIGAGTSSTTVGAETSASGNLNVISGNLGDGVSITSSSGNNLSFDYFGVDLNNTLTIPNHGNGVSIHGSAAVGNRVNLDVIRNNGGYGILTDTGATGNAWYYDSIFGNALGGIAQLTNPNLQSAPVLFSATVANGQTTVVGTVTDSPDKSAGLVVMFYASPTPTSPAAVQGLKFIGQAIVTTDANGNASFTATLSTAVPGGQIVTATDDYNVSNTSNFSNAVSVPLTSSASFLGTDTTTVGNWRNSYGADGYDIEGDTSGKNPNLPSYATLSTTGASTYTWTSSTTDVRALQNAANSGRIASAWYTGSSMSFDLDITDGKTHEVSLYAVDWDTTSRAEQVQVIDAASGTVLSTQNLSSFHGGDYLSWNISGNVIIEVTKVGGNNAVVSGLFFGGPSSNQTSASFVSADTTTQGNWHGVYGTNGYDIEGDTSASNPKLPSYATLSVTGASTYTWAASTTDVRALQNAANTGRLAATWYSGSTMSFNLDFTDGKVHQFSLYAVDWDTTGRSEEVQVLNAATGAVLDTRTISSFHGGEYLTWNLSGNVVIKVTAISGNNAVVSGLFFD